MTKRAASTRVWLWLLGLAVVGLLAVGPAVAQEQATAGQAVPDFSDDKTGTNPANLMTTFILFNDYRDLPYGFYYNTFHARALFPFANRRANVRIDVPWIKTDLPFGASSDGMGDLNLRVNYLPYVTSKRALLVALEANFDTAKEMWLGRGKNTVSPMLCYAFFLPNNFIFAPAYQHNISVSGDDSRADINEGYLDFYMVKTTKNKYQWLVLDPHLIIDYENDNHVSGTVEVEAGSLVGRMLGGVGSVYLRPGVGFGDYRIYNWNIQLGFKLILVPGLPPKPAK